MNLNLPQQIDRESPNQLSKEELVDIMIEQAIAIQQLQATITELKQEVGRLGISRDLDSKTSLKPPSGDILKKSEKKKPGNELESNRPKRKSGGQPGHQGKTRKGFGRIDCFEILRPEFCTCCGNTKFLSEAVKIETQQVTQLVERPIEIVEYHRQICRCSHCENLQAADWSDDIIPGQDLGVRLQAFVGWINNYGHLPYEKQKEMLWELGQIEIALGTLVATNERITQAIEPSINQLSSWLKQTQSNIHVDKTPWSVKGVANSEFCLFTTANTRSKAELKAILGSQYQAVINSDDYSLYNGYQAVTQQKCLARLAGKRQTLEQ